MIDEIVNSEAFASAVDPDAARANLERFADALADGEKTLRWVAGQAAAVSHLANIFGGSPSLSDSLIGNPEWLDWLIDQLAREGTKSRLSFLNESRKAVAAANGDAERIRAIHRFHRREILRIGARDLTCRVDVRDITNELSWLADAVVQMAFEQAWGESSARSGNSDLRFAVVGVGKLGGEELNFSSDIDIIYLYSGETHADTSTRLARRISEILTEHTGDGALYRVDLRLRPEGVRGAIASSIRALHTYYDSWGETFERLALTKARVVAGHEDAGHRFMTLIEPFVYRKYLDFAAIDEIRDIKIRIDQQVERSVGGERHIKLGRGGIREIEFFVQVLQVVYGGELEDIRARNTLIALQCLENAHLIERSVSRRLADAYVFLRNLEHKLQIVHQLQTHELPDDHKELQRCAARMKMTLPQFQAELSAHRNAVHSIFHDLFAGKTRTDEGAAGSVHRFLNHTMDEVQTRAWLGGIGFEDPAGSCHILSVLRDAPAFGHSPARMKNLLENVLTPVLENAAKLGGPDYLLVRFARLIESVGARETFFTSLLENSRSLARLTHVLALSEYLSEILFALPEVLDFLIDEERLVRPLRWPAATMDRRVQEFYAGVQYLFGILPRRRAARLLTRFAERELRACVPAASAVAIFAAGKFGEREPSIRSDLDIIAFHEGSHAAALQVLDDLTVRLSPQFRIDLRLRPDGRKGSLICSPQQYREYLSTRGETWERMALTKARFVAGNPAIGVAVQGIVDEFVYGKGFDAPEVGEMRAIRRRMEYEIGKETETAFDLKVGRGGLVDIEFLCQIEQIRNNVRIANTVTALKRVHSLPAVLIQHYEFLRNLECALRLSSANGSSRFDVHEARTLGSMLGVKDFLGEYRRVTDDVRGIWDKG